MSKIKKIFIIIISLLVLGFFLLFTFLANNKQHLEKLDFLPKEKISNLDKIDSNKKNSYKIEGNNIILKKDLYFFDFLNTNKNYNIIGTNFIINTLGLGKIYINNKNPESIIIYNFDNIIDLDFLDKNKKSVNKIKLFPHNLAIFSKSNINLINFKGANLARIKNFITIKYLNSSFLEKKYDKLLISENFLKELEEILKKNTGIKRFLKQKSNFLVEQKDFLKKEFNKIILKEEKNKKIFKKLKEYKVGNIKINKFLEKYSFLSLNKEKFKIYKQNIILKQIHNLFLDNSLDDINISEKQRKKLKQENKEKFDKLEKDFKTLDKESYKKLINILKQYYIILAQDNNIKNIKKKNNFTKLLTNLGEKNEIINYTKQYYNDFEKLNSIYNSYDLQKNIENGENGENILIQNFYIFSKIFLQKINILEENTTNKNKLLNSYGVFLYNFIKNNLNLKTENIKGYNELLATYIKINNNKNEENPDKVLENIDLLEKIEKTFRNTFFEKERKKGKLILNYNGKNKNNDEIDKLEKNIDSIVLFINQNITLINKDNNKIYENKLNDLNKKFDEYYFAINQTKQYLQKSKSTDIKNSIIKKDNNLKNNITLNDIKKYINSFKNIYIDSKTEIKKQENYFNIKNLKLGENKRISFHLYPEQNNLIDSIKIIQNNKEKIIQSSYILDNRKEDWKKRQNNSRDKTKYDFNYFFSNTFDKEKIIKKSEDKQDNQNNQTEEYIETGKIIKLKRERLLGKEKGELSNLKDIMNVSYSKIFIKEDEQGNFDIKLKEIPLYIKVESGNTIQNKTGFFSSNYILDDTETYFSNIKIKLGTSQREELGGNQINIIGTIKYFKARKYFTQIMKKSEQIKFIYNNIFSILKIKDVKINYYIGSDIVIYQFKYNKNGLEKNIKIKTNGEKIVSLERNMENILGGDIIDYKELKYSLEALK